MSLNAQESIQNARAGYPTVQHDMADQLVVLAKQMATGLILKGDKHLQEMGAEKAPRDIQDVLLISSLAVCRSEGADVKLVGSLPMKRALMFPAEEITKNGVRFACLNTLEMSKSKRIADWASNTSWDQVKPHLWIYVTGLGWDRWIEAVEKEYDEWCGDVIERGSKKEITFLVGVDEAEVERVQGDEIVEINSQAAWAESQDLAYIASMI